MSTLELKELSHPSGEVIKIAAGKTLDLKSQGTTTLPTGSVLQVVSVTKTQALSANITSALAITGLSVNITPTNASSKILVTSSVVASTGSGSRAFIEIRKDGSSLVQGNSANNRRRCHAQIQNSDAGFMNSIAMQFLDSPNTTSSITYQVYGLDEGGSTPININLSSSDTDGPSRGRGVSTITVMEIQG